MAEPVSPTPDLVERLWPEDERTVRLKARCAALEADLIEAQNARDTEAAHAHRLRIRAEALEARLAVVEKALTEINKEAQLANASMQSISDNYALAETIMSLARSALSPSPAAGKTT